MNGIPDKNLPAEAESSKWNDEGEESRPEGGNGDSGVDGAHDGHGELSDELLDDPR